MAPIPTDLDLDCRGMNCPLPVLKTKKAMEALAPGQVLKMTASDPGSESDIPAWARATGNELLEHTVQGKDYIFYLRKKQD